MSDQTKAALETALAAHFADEAEGAYALTHWVVMMEGARMTDGPASNLHHYATSDGSTGTILGLGVMLEAILRHNSIGHIISE